MPVLSVVVPTHNRANYAVSCIEAVLGLNDSGLQLVVTDTSSDQRLYGMLHSECAHLLSDPRLKYRKIDEPSSLTKNHNDALALADGEYVCVIGDDDCITSAALDAARWASEHAIPLVSQTITANYAWADFRSLLARTGHAARLYVPKKVHTGRWKDSATGLRMALESAFQSTNNLPRCYHGIVRRDILETIRARTGAYFHGSSPDMSSAVSLACLVDKYLEVETPLSIPGASSGSNSGRVAMNTHKGDLSSETQTKDFEESGWTTGVPRFFSAETVWAHAGLEALAKLRPDLLPEFNYARLLALCSLRHGEYRSHIDAAARELRIQYGLEMENSIAQEMRRERWRRCKYMIRRAALPTAAHGRRYLRDLPNVAAASRRYEEYARANRFSFEPVEP